MKTKVTNKAYDALRRERVEATFKLDPLVRLTLGGNDYTLEMNNRAVKRVLLDTGFNILTAGVTAAAMVDPVTVGSIFYRALETHHPDMTLDKADTLFSTRHSSLIYQKLRDVCTLFIPQMDDVEIEAVPDDSEDKDPTKP